MIITDKTKALRDKYYNRLKKLTKALPERIDIDNFLKAQMLINEIKLYQEFVLDLNNLL